MALKMIEKKIHLTQIFNVSKKVTEPKENAV